LFLDGAHHDNQRQVMKWERMHCDECATPKLVKFLGRPRDFSPQARINQLMGYRLPFDRHDWTVDRCGTKVRYVIDFYSGKLEEGKAVAYHLDVRPALDNWQAVQDRVRMAMGPYIASGFQLPSTNTLLPATANMQSASKTEPSNQK
jgi:cytochrome c heme-lyase